VRIVEITTTHLHAPGFRGNRDATIRHAVPGRAALFVHVKTDAGIEGLGVCDPNARTLIEHTLKPLLLGQDPLCHEKLWDDMFWRLRGIGRKGLALCALSGVDIALWDLKAKVFGVPLYRLLGPFTDAVPIYASGGWTSLDEAELVREQVGFVEHGIPRVKMKVAKDFGHAEREDLRRLAAVRKAVGDAVEIYVDANGGYSAKQAIDLSRRFEDYDVKWFEEPVLADDIEGLAEIARATTIPVASGEHEYTKYGFRELIGRRAVDIVQPDVARVGGVTEWLKVAHLAHAFNLPVAPHAYQLIHLHLACATPNLKVVEYLSQTEEGDRLWYTEFPEPRAGMWSPYPDRPGLGLELAPAAVRTYSVD
jgi:L-alanine-DL-glutamate epimerase-like enolase superfamily enzyme